MKIKHHYEPWEFMEIEDFLPSLRFQEIEHLAQKELEKYHIEGINTRRGKYVKFLKEDILPEINPIFHLLPRRQSTGELKKLIHWAITPPGVHYPTHIDNASRLSTVTYYITPEKNTGTIICKNPSKNDDGDHGAPDLPTESEFEITWKPNKIFLHCGGPGKWHRYSGKDQPRIIISSFLVQPSLINKGRPDHNYLIDI